MLSSERQLIEPATDAAQLLVLVLVPVLVLVLMLVLVLGLVLVLVLVLGFPCTLPSMYHL